MSNIVSAPWQIDAINDLDTFSETDLQTLYKFYNVHNISDLAITIYFPKFYKGMLLKDEIGIKPDNYEPSRHIPYKPLDYYGIKQKKLGKGTYGDVVLYTSTHGSFAIKKISKHPLENEGINTSVLRELAVLVRCQHPNIVPVYDIQASLEKTYIVMPLASMDLDTFIKKGISLPVRKTIVKQILEAFAYLANKDILHRDLKPQNILVYLKGLTFEKIEIADFGLSRPGGCINETGMTNKVYTLHYRPLELLGEDSKIGYGSSADIWSIGCVIYELYSGKTLWPGDSPIDMIYRIWRTFGNETQEQIDDIKAIQSEFLNNMFKIKFKGDSSFIKNNVKDSEITNMIIECLHYNPEKRPSAQKLLSTYFTKNQLLDGSSCEQSFLVREWYPSNGIKNHPDINEKMLRITQDWLIEVWRMFKLSDRTFFVTAFLIDWIISKSSKEFIVSRGDLQIVASTAQLIASKFCEVLHPEINDYVYITAGAYTKDQIMEIELKILKACNYDLIFSVSNDFKLSGSYKDAQLHKITLMAITFCNLRFELLPHEQNELALNIVNKMLGGQVEEKYTELIGRFKKEFSSINKSYHALNKYAILEKNLGYSYTEMLNKL